MALPTSVYLQNINSSSAAGVPTAWCSGASRKTGILGGEDFSRRFFQVSSIMRNILEDINNDEIFDSFSKTTKNTQSLLLNN